MPINLEELLVESIKQNSSLATKIGGVETTLQHIRSDNAQMLRDFNDALRTITDIQRQLLTNTDDHKIVHARIDEVKDELDEVRESINSIKTTCTTNGHYRVKVEALEELISQLEFAAKVFGCRVFGAPVWIIVCCMVGMGFVIDVVKHRDVVDSLMGLIK